jgi:tRNA (guanine26-N2/guanine27-N2)-dimethyltransferase
MKKITEGRAQIFVPAESLTKNSEAFYNPAMEHQRNVTVACARILDRKKILDPLAATGIRGIRLIREASAEKIVFNDRNPNAIKLIQKNLRLNKIAKRFFEVRGEDANSLFLEKEKYDYIDIDPFGSPVRYLFNAGYALGNHSAIGVTATDCGALSGKFASACFRRYGIFVTETDFPKELGIRVLITSVLQNLAKHGLTFEPLYSHANHYFRVIGSVHYGAERNLREIQMVSYCPRCHSKKTGIESRCENCKSRMQTIGPLWTGKIQGMEFCKRLLANFEFAGLGRKEITMCTQEIDQPFYFDLHMIAKSLKTSSPKMENVIEKLRSKGFEASRTHLCLTGIKTNANIKGIIRTLK